MKKAVSATTWEEIEISTGLTRLHIEKAGRMVALSNATIACWAMGRWSPLRRAPGGDTRGMGRGDGVSLLRSLG